MLRGEPSRRGIEVKSPTSKVTIVAIGYAAAMAVAFAAVAVRVAFTRHADAQASSGMFAFGDALLFLSVFGVVGLIPTAAALFFLRPYRAFWWVISASALLVAATGVAAAILYALGRDALEPSTLATLAALSVLRILAAPLFAFGFLLATLLSPFRTSRLAFLAATGLEAAVCAYAALAWFVPLLFDRF